VAAEPPANESGDAVRFILDGQTIAVRDVAPTTTLLQYLRETLGRSGTKEGCAEGDCGACTVVVGELSAGAVADPGDDPIAYRAVNACIRFLPTLDGKEVVTAESLQARGGPLHPVQQALIDCHGSQCGFCTPGFVMSLFGLYLNASEAGREEVLDALAGNLCRCTGYRPIVDAGCRMHEYPQPAHWSREDAQSDARRDALLAIRRRTSLAVKTAPGFRAPLTLDELAQAYESAPDSLLLAGSTDIGLWVTKQLRDLPPLIYLGEVAELQRIGEAGGVLEIGAAVRLTEAYAAIVAHYPMLDEIGNRFASPPIRNAGTLCGNIANGSPIGDSMPFLIALGASVELRRGKRSRSLPLDELYLGYQKKALAPGEFVAAVRIPLPKAGLALASYKVSKRFDQDISAVCGAYALHLRDGRIDDARIAYGGMAAIPLRARRTEASLLGRPWTEATMESAVPQIAADFAPLSDMRASSGYRVQVAGNLLKRFYHEHSGAGGPSRVSAVAAD
jgi:xanthine dehydrogenase small subunit